MAGLADYRNGRLGGVARAQGMGQLGQGISGYRPLTQQQRAIQNFGRSAAPSTGGPAATATGPSLADGNYAGPEPHGVPHPSSLRLGNIAAQKQLDDHAYFRDQYHQAHVEAIQAPYQANAQTYASMGQASPYRRGLQDYSDKLARGGRPTPRIGIEQMTPSGAALLAGRGGDYGPDPSVPPASHYAYTGVLPNGAANDRRYQHGTEFTSSTGNGMKILSTRDADGRVGLHGTPQEAAGVQLSNGDGVRLTNGVGINPETGNPVYAQGLQAYFAKNAARDQEPKARRVLAMAAQNGVPMNSPLLRAAQARLGVSPEMKRFQEAAIQAHLQQFQQKVARNNAIQDRIHKLQTDIALGNVWDRTAAESQVEQLRNLIEPLPQYGGVPQDLYRQGLGAYGRPRVQNPAIPLDAAIQPTPGTKGFTVIPRKD